MRINLSRVTNDERLQRRVKGLDSDHVQTMAQLLRDDAAFDLPPVSAVSEGNDFHFWDGWHRIEAYRVAKRKDIPATVTKGTWRDAWKESFGANGTHGLTRTKADIEAVLKAAFDDDELGKQSDNQIAKLTGLSHPTVGKYRKKLSCKALQDSDSDSRTVTRNGTTYPMNTANIGKKDTPENEDKADSEKPKPEANGKAETNGKHEGNGKVDPTSPETDANGDEIPERTQEAFITAKNIASLCKEIDGILKRAEELSKSFGGRLIRIDSVRQQLKDAKGNLWANRATHVCPYCKAVEQAPCEVCKGEGWTAKHVWMQAPGNSKKAVRA